MSGVLGEVLDAWSTCARDGVSCVAVTLVAARGSAPQVVGAKLLATREGLRAGTIGGGKLEAHALARAEAMIAAGEPAGCALETVNLQRDLGMTCGGEVSLLFERVGTAPWQIAVFGAGHVAQALVRLLATLDARVSVFDTRPAWIDRIAKGPSVEAFCVEDLPARVRALSDGTFVVVMTQGHGTDLPVLREAFAWGRFGYLGVMGSAVKAARIRTELAAAGETPERLAQLRCPIGLAVGESVPSEIAVSVAAELLQVRGAVRRGSTRDTPPR